MKKRTMFIVKAAVIAAIYAALTLALHPVAYGPIQFRASEALSVLCVFTPAAIPGLTVGCFLSNLGSPYGVIDIVVGTLATLLSVVCGYYTRKVRVKTLPLLTLLFPCIFNGIMVGAEIAYTMPQGFKWSAFLIAGLEVAAGEFVVCYLLGLPLFKAIDKTKLKDLLK